MPALHHHGPAAGGHASAREQRFVQAVAAWVQGDIARAIALHEEQARAYPRDLASLKLGQYHLFNQGNSPGMLRMALHALPRGGRGALPARHGWPSPGSSATCCAQADAPPATPSGCAPRSPGPTMRWPM
jgi:hypothetical protein